MSFLAKKKVVVKLLDEALKEFENLNRLIKSEKDKGIKSSFNQTLLKGINDKIELLKLNYDAGTQIPRKKIPKNYFEKFEVTNLWKINLPGYWRMIYTLNQPQREITEVSIITVWLDVLGILDHNKYNRIFKYRKK